MKTEEIVPEHVAIIMDGNRRWATNRGLPKIMGHTEGAKVMKKVAVHAKKRGISYITFWALSTENVRERSEEELKHLFSLFKQLVEYLADLKKDGVRVLVVGDIEGLPNDVQEALSKVVQETKDGTTLTMVLGVNYGGRNELLRMVRKVVVQGVLADDLNEEIISANLDTVHVPDPNLVIRTGGKHRLSGFLPWQSVYSELYFTDVFWPDFDDVAFDTALEWYASTERNFGK